MKKWKGEDKGQKANKAKKKKKKEQIKCTRKKSQSVFVLVCFSKKMDGVGGDAGLGAPGAARR